MHLWFVVAVVACFLSSNKTFAHNITMAEERLITLDGVDRSAGECHVLYFAKEAEGLARAIASLSEGAICLGSLSWGKFPDGYCTLSCLIPY